MGITVVFGGSLTHIDWLRYHQYQWISSGDASTGDRAERRHLRSVPSGGHECKVSLLFWLGIVFCGIGEAVMFMVLFW